MRYGGTAFFLELREGDYRWTYLITAKHCIGLGPIFETTS